MLFLEGCAVGQPTQMSHKNLNAIICESLKNYSSSQLRNYTVIHKLMQLVALWWITVHISCKSVDFYTVVEQTETK